MSSEKRIILVVDDTPENIDILSGIFRSRFKVKAALNGERALMIAAAEPKPDIVLLDIMMPGMDGYEVCRKLKDNPLTMDIPVIFITAKSETNDEQKGFELGAVDYITKPFDPLIVDTRVHSQLAIHEKSRKLQQENIELKKQVGGYFQDYTENELQQLVDRGESDNVEFKTTLRFNLHSGKADKKIENACLKTIAAFLNSAGGILLIGVQDDGCVVGLANDRFANEDKQLLHWNNLFNAHLGIESSQFVRAEMKSLAGERILMIQSLSSSRPVFFSRDNEEIFYIRAGNSTRQLKPSEVLSYVEQRNSCQN